MPIQDEQPISAAFRAGCRDGYAHSNTQLQVLLGSIDPTDTDSIKLITEEYIRGYQKGRWEFTVKILSWLVALILFVVLWGLIFWLGATIAG